MPESTVFGAIDFFVLCRLFRMPSGTRRRLTSMAGEFCGHREWKLL